MNIAPASLAFVVLSSSAFAQAAVGLAYEAPEGCPAERDFVAAVAARVADFDGLATNVSHRVMVVAIRKQGDGFAGVFQLRDGETATDKREVQAPSCAEVVDAMAVVTAIALVPEIATPAKPVPTAVPPPPPPENERLQGNTFIYQHTHESVTVPAGKLSFDLVRALNFYGGLMVGAAPSTVMPRFDLSMTAGNFVTAPDGSQRIVGIILRSRLTFLGPGTYQSPDTKTNLDGFAFGTGGCLTPHYDSAGLVLLFCTDVGVGGMNLRTTGTGGTLIQSKFVGFGSISSGVEARYNLTSLVNVGIKVGWDVYLGSRFPPGRRNAPTAGSRDLRRPQQFGLRAPGDRISILRYLVIVAAAFRHHSLWP